MLQRLITEVGSCIRFSESQDTSILRVSELLTRAICCLVRFGVRTFKTSTIKKLLGLEFLQLRPLPHLTYWDVT